MNNLKLLLATFVLVAVVPSCTNDLSHDLLESNSLNNDDVYINVPDTTKFISPERALEVAASHTKVYASRAERTVENLEVVTDDNGDVLLYVINYADDQGFIIVSATREYFPILAESDTGCFHLDDITDQHPASLWLNERKFYVKHASTLPDSTRSRIDMQWIAYSPAVPYDELNVTSRAEVPDKPQVFYDSLRQWSMDPNVKVYRWEEYILTDSYRSLSDYEKERIKVGIYTYGNGNYGTPESSTLVIIQYIDNGFRNQILTTQWDQFYPFNDYSESFFHALGCTTIAAGQVMKHYRFPAKFNWDEMPDKGASHATKSFLEELKAEIGVVNKPVEGSPFQPGGASDSQVRAALVGYGYSVSAAPHDFSKIRDRLRFGTPVIQFGYNLSTSVGHAWVCDGLHEYDLETKLRFMTLDYRPTSYSTPDKMVEAYSKSLNRTCYTNVRFNWGWGGNQDAYYDDESFTVTIDGVKTHYRDNRLDMIVTPNR